MTFIDAIAKALEECDSITFSKDAHNEGAIEMTLEKEYGVDIKDDGHMGLCGKDEGFIISTRVQNWMIDPPIAHVHPDGADAFAREELMKDLEVFLKSIEEQFT